MQSTGQEDEDRCDFLFKIILIGDSNVGKTCVIHSFKSGLFSDSLHNTIGVDFTVRTIDIDGKRVKVSSHIRIKKNLSVFLGALKLFLKRLYRVIYIYTYTHVHTLLLKNLGSVRFFMFLRESLLLIKAVFNRSKIPKTPCNIVNCFCNF